MKMKPPQTSWIALSARAYRALLILYPADYRREYGALMVQMFRDVCRDAYRRRGLMGILMWWCKTILDLAVTVFEQRRKVKLVFPKSLLGRQAGLLLMLGGAFSALAAISQFQPDDHYIYYGIYQVLMLMFAPAYALIGLGCFGLAQRYAETFSTISKWLLYLTGIGALVMVVGLVATALRNTLWNIWFAGGIVHVIALTLFGLVHLRTPTLPVFRGLPLMMAGGWLVLMFGVLRTASQTSNNLLSFLFMFGMGLGWLAIGMAINRQQRATVSDPRLVPER
jgi:hypothetical protein